MLFDRYETHIQALVHFIDGKLIIFQSSSPQKHIFQIYTQNIFQKNNFQKNNAQLQARKSRNYGFLSFVLLK